MLLCFLIFKGVSSWARSVLRFAGALRCSRAIRAGLVLLRGTLTFPALAFAGVSTRRTKMAGDRLATCCSSAGGFLCSVTLGNPVYLAVFLVCESRVCLSAFILLEMCVVSLM